MQLAVAFCAGIASRQAVAPSILATRGLDAVGARLREAAQHAFKHRAHGLQRIVGRHAWRALVPATHTAHIGIREYGCVGFQV